MSIKHFIYAIGAVYSLTAANLKAQDKYFTKSGKIGFEAVHHSSVSAVSRSAVVTLDSQTGEFQFSILVKSFEFEKALMQEKFNHSILETDQFPRALFKGYLENPLTINYQKDGDYPVQVKGLLTLHGITKNITASGKLSVMKGVITTQSAFNVALDDYNISNPGIGDGNIIIKVVCSLEPLKDKS